MDSLLILEISATILSLIYLILIIKENVWCWLFGFVGSVLTAILMYEYNLYSEAMLYLFFAVMAIYGYYIWTKEKVDEQKKELPITDFSITQNLKMVMTGLTLGLLMGLLSSTYTDADLPFIDSQTTAFSFVATFLHAHKILSGWLFWIVINAATIGLYAYKGIHIYTGLMVVYLLVSFYGYWDWKRKLSF